MLPYLNHTSWAILLFAGIHNPNEYRWIYLSLMGGMHRSEFYLSITSLNLNSSQWLVSILSPLKPVFIQAVVQSFLIHVGISLSTEHNYPV